MNREEFKDLIEGEEFTLPFSNDRSLVFCKTQGVVSVEGVEMEINAWSRDPRHRVAYWFLRPDEVVRRF